VEPIQEADDEEYANCNELPLVKARVKPLPPIPENKRIHHRNTAALNSQAQSADHIGDFNYLRLCTQMCSCINVINTMSQKNVWPLPECFKVIVFVSASEWTVLKGRWGFKRPFVSRVIAIPIIVKWYCRN